jgi:hypothetical protein
VDPREIQLGWWTGKEAARWPIHPINEKVQSVNLASAQISVEATAWELGMPPRTLGYDLKKVEESWYFGLPPYWTYLLLVAKDGTILTGSPPVPQD